MDFSNIFSLAYELSFFHCSKYFLPLICSKTYLFFKGLLFLEYY